MQGMGTNNPGSGKEKIVTAEIILARRPLGIHVLKSGILGNRSHGVRNLYRSLDMSTCPVVNILDKQQDGRRGRSVCEVS